MNINAVEMRRRKSNNYNHAGDIYIFEMFDAHDRFSIVVLSIFYLLYQKPFLHCRRKGSKKGFLCELESAPKSIEKIKILQCFWALFPYIIIELI